MHPSARLGERREGQNRGARLGRGRRGSSFFLGFFGMLGFWFTFTPPKSEHSRVNSIWPMPFHCLRHTTVSTTSQNTHDPHIPPRIPEIGRTAAACSRSQRFGLGDQWRFSVDFGIHPPNLDGVPNRKRVSKSADLEAFLDLNPRFPRRAVCFARTGVSGTSVSVRRASLVAVREDLLNAISHYVSYYVRSFKFRVEYNVPGARWRRVRREEGCKQK